MPKTTSPRPEPTTPPTDAGTGPLLRIQEVASEVGLTARSIRYYEEVGLLEPAGRSEGDYRLYDSSDLERLRYIRSLRDDAGFSLAQIGQLLEDEAARERNRERFRSTQDPEERRALLQDAVQRVDRQIDTLETKAARLHQMIEAARERRRHLEGHLAETAGGPAPHPDRASSDAGLPPTAADTATTGEARRTRRR